jgi:nicotinamide phosphoribosyltransferase
VENMKTVIEKRKRKVKIVKTNELASYTRLLEQFPNGILSLVSDTFDLFKICTEILPQLKDKIMARNGKTTIRPDSGNPVDILCGLEITDGYDLNNKYLGSDFSIDYDKYAIKTDDGKIYRVKPHFGYEGEIYSFEANKNEELSINEVKGVVELLWDVFGGTVNEKGYKVLDPHIGVIYGDSITLDRAEKICARLEAKGFASTNVVFGIGSYTYNYNTRDTLGIAVKSTYCEVMENGVLERREIFKDPITDDGTKKSARGLLCVKRDENGKLYLKDRCTEEEERDDSLLNTVFHNGNYVTESFATIKQRLENEKA